MAFLIAHGQIRISPVFRHIPFLRCELEIKRTLVDRKTRVILLHLLRQEEVHKLFCHIRLPGRCADRKQRIRFKHLTALSLHRNRFIVPESLRAFDRRRRDPCISGSNPAADQISRTGDHTEKIL